MATGAAPPGALLRLYLNGAFLANVTTGSDGRWSLTVEHGMTGGAYAIRADEIDRAKGSVIARAEVPFNYPQLVADQAAAAKPPAPASVASPAPIAASPKPPAAASESPRMGAAETPAPSRPEVAAPLLAATPPRPEAAPPSLVAAASSAADAVASSSAPAPASPADAPPQAFAGIPAPTDAANAIVRNVDTKKVVRGDNLWRISSHFYGNGLRYKQIYAANAAQIRDPWLIYPGQIFVLPRQTPF